MPVTSALEAEQGGSRVQELKTSLGVRGGCTAFARWQLYEAREVDKSNSFFFFLNEEVDLGIENYPLSNNQ